MHIFNDLGKKCFTSFLVLLFVVQQSMLVPVLASDISGIAGERIDGSNNLEFNIDPQKVMNGNGFRHYGHFQLTEGDIANFIYEHGMQNFINLVDSRININGLVNTLAGDNSFYNGHLLFVSPQGMVVGSSGVLNVGSLTAIAPNNMDYLKYTGYNLGQGVLDEAIGNLGLESGIIKIPGVSDDVNLKLLKEADPSGTIDINGKIISRGNVELLAKHVNVQGVSQDGVIKEAGIIAGVDSSAKSNNIKIQTLNQADRMFDALVNNDVHSGKGFGVDNNGNIIIKAQSTQIAELVTPETQLVNKAKNVFLDQVIELADNELGYIISKEKLAQFGITEAEVQTAIDAVKDQCSTNNAANPDAMNNDNYASVTVMNAFIGGNNVDINAVSKVDYTAQKGCSIFDRVLSESLNAIMDGLIEGSDFGTFEGSRAKASVTIGEGAILEAVKNVSAKSLAVANTNMKLGGKIPPVIDTNSQLFYYLGTKTDANTSVLDKAIINAGQDVNINAATRNSLNVKIKNPSSIVEGVGGKVGGVPSMQFSLLKTKVDADTTAKVAEGATIKAGKDVNVNAVNITNDLTTLNAVSVIAEKEGDASQSGVSVAVILKDDTINTNAEVSGDIEVIETTDKDGVKGRHGDVKVNAQNMHAELSSAKASVSKATRKNKVGIKGIIATKIADLIESKVKGIADGMDSIKDANSKLPSVSTALIVNDTTVNATAKVTPTATIKAGNVNVNANTVDITVNNATSKVAIPKDTAAKNTYTPSPGVSVVVNNQKNTTKAIVDRANITADKNLTVNATTEQPMNESTFEFLLNLIQLGADIGSLDDKVEGTVQYGMSDDWDLRLLTQSLQNITGDVSYDVQNLKFQFKNNIKGTLGLQGFFNNWVQSTSSSPKGIGLAASVLVSDVINNTIAEISGTKDKPSFINVDNLIVNAANEVVQFNAAGDVGKIFKITDGVSGSTSGVGGTVVVESVDSNAIAKINDNVVVNAKNNIDINSANQQSFLTAVMTGGKSTSNKGISITGSTVVQDVTGTTESSIGKSTLKAKNIKVKAGKAKIATVPKAHEELERDPFKNVKGSGFDISLDPDMSAATIYKYTDADIELKADPNYFDGPDSLTSTSTLVGSGDLKLNKTSEISDRISNLMITGALAKQEAKSENDGAKSSAGIATGASVNVSEFSRAVNALIKKGADIQVEESLEVLADSKAQSLNLALAGAFAGGIKMDKEPSFIDKGKEFLKNKSDEYLLKLKGVLGKVAAASGVDKKIADATGVNIQDALKDNTVQNDLNNSGNIGSNVAKGGDVAKTANASTAANNMSTALAGSVNVQINDATVLSSVDGAKIKVGKDLKVEANQVTKNLNIGGGIANGATVGGGAAVNFIENVNHTKALLYNSNVEFTGEKSNLDVLASENNDNVQVAIGVGVAKKDKTPSSNDENADKTSKVVSIPSKENGGNNGQQNSSTAVSLGGSFNTDILENEVIAEIGGTKNKIFNKVHDNSTKVNVDAENYSTAYKGAGGFSINIGGQDSQGQKEVGAGMGGNINIINKTTNATVVNSDIKNASSVSVLANKDADKKTEDLVTVGVAGSVLTGAESAYSFNGAIGVDVINNTIQALVRNSSIKASDNISVEAKNNLYNGNIAGALGFSTAAKGAGVGLGTVVNVVTSNVEASVSENSNLQTSKDINVKAYDNEVLKFLAVNCACTKSNAAVVNAIVNVLDNTVKSTINNSNVLGSEGLSVESYYASTIAGITNADAVVAGESFAAGGNAVVNVLSSNVNSSIDRDKKTNTNDINSSGKVNVKSTSNTDLNIIPVGVSISTKGKIATAANVAVNVIGNTTSAKINNSNLVSQGVEVVATDITSSKNRGGTLATAIKGASVAGSVLVDVLNKDVDATISNSEIEANINDVIVSATAENCFGPKETPSIDINNIKNSANISDASSIADWQMVYDLAAGENVSVSGSLLAKIAQNHVDAAIQNSIIKSGKLDVLAENGIYTRGLVGNISAGKASIGASTFVNVNIGTTTAKIENSEISAKNKIVNDKQYLGDINVSANSVQDYKTVMAFGGIASSVAANASANSNTAKDTTTALINNTAINESNSINVKANSEDNVESLNIGVQASGNTEAGGIVYNNNFLNTVNAHIIGNKNKKIVTNKDVNVEAGATESFGANALIIGGASTAAVSAITIANVIDSNINALVNGALISDAKSVNVIANHDYNRKKYGNTTSPFTEFMNENADKTVTAEALTARKAPIVSLMGISGSGNASVSVNSIIDTINADTIASVQNSDINSDSIKIEATSKEELYNAISGIAASGNASVGASTIVNVLNDTTIAELKDSTVKANDVLVNALQDTNLNTVLFMASGAGTGAGVGAVAGENIMDNKTTATINKSNIKSDNIKTAKTNVTAKTNISSNSIGVAASGVGVGAAVNALSITNASDGKTKASIENNSNILNGKTLVKANSDTILNNLIAGGTFSGEGAAVGAYVPVNTLTNDVDAYVIDSYLDNNFEGSSISADSVATLKTIVAVAGINGVGATVGTSALVNIIDNDVNAFMRNSSVNNGALAINASQTSDISGLVASVNVGGASVAAGLNSVTNVLGGRINSYIDNVISENVAFDVDVKSTEKIQYELAALSGSGIVAATGAAIVNTVNNNLAAYINNSKLNKGSVDIDSNKTITLKNGIKGTSLSGSASAGAGAIVNVVSSNNKAYIANTEAKDLSGINIDAISKEIITGDNYIGSAAICAGGAVSTLVNVIEETTKAYIDTVSSKNITTKDLVVNAQDDIDLSSIAGSVAVVLSAAAGASVNVNVINNSVVSQLAGSGTINADRVDVSSNSDILYSVGSMSTAASGVGLSNTVSVTSIGNKFEDSTNLSSTNAKGSVEQAQNITNGLGNSYTIKHVDGSQTKYDAPEVVLVASTDNKQQGTLANIAADVTSKNNISVKATNKSDNTLNTLNATAGVYGAGTNVNVVNTTYNTQASINSGKVSSTEGNISINANNEIISNKSSLAASAGLGMAKIGVDYFNNDSKTLAITGKDATLKANNVDLLAKSKDNINMVALSTKVAGVSGDVSVALAETNNHTTSKVGSSVIANNLNINAINSSVLETIAHSGTASLYSGSAAINKAVSNSVTEALIDAVGNNINLTGDLNLKTATTGMKVINDVVVGSASYMSADVANYGAIANSSFNSLINNGDVKANNINILAGLQAVESDDGSLSITDDAGLVEATVNSKKYSVAIGSGAVSKLYANAAGNATAGAKNGNIIANNIVNISSKLHKNAKSTSESLSISGVDLGAINLQTNVSGNVLADTNGANIIAKGVNINANSNSVSNAELTSGSVSLGSIKSNSTSATIEDNTNIVSGNINAENINMNVDVSKQAKIVNSNHAVSLANVGSSTINTKIMGISGVTTKGDIKNNSGLANSLNIKVNESSIAENEASEGSISFIRGASLNIVSEIQSQILNNLEGVIKSENFDINNVLDRTVISNATSKTASLGQISSMNLNSIIENGITTNVNSNIESNKMNLNSVMKNMTKSYVQESFAGLVALSGGETRNDVKASAINKTVFGPQSKITAGSISAMTDSDSASYMHRTSTSTGAIIVKGGDIINHLNGTSQIDIDGANITTTGDAKFGVKNRASTDGVMYFDDDASGFITDNGASLSNRLMQTAKLNVSGKSNIKSHGDLVLSVDNGTKFLQEVQSDASGFTAHNNANSVLTATINNAINIDEESVLQGKNVNIDMNSSNKLSSVATAEARHFAGSPSVNAEVNLTVNNDFNLKGNSSLQAFDTNPEGTKVSLNFMDKSTQDINQKAHLFAEAAVATGDSTGGINFTTNNNANIEKGSTLSSSKDVFINFKRGVENLNSYVGYKKISRLLFGIPITDRDSWPSIKTPSSNNLIVDGTIIAGGKNTPMNLVIHKDGTTEGSLSEANGHFTRTDGDMIEGAAPGSEKAKAEENKIQAQINELEQKLEALNKDKLASTNEKKALENQIQKLNLQLETIELIKNMSENDKITNSKFRNDLISVLDEYDVKDSANYVDQLIAIFTADKKEGLFVDANNTDCSIYYKRDANGNIVYENGKTVFEVINSQDGSNSVYKYKYDGNKIATDANGNFIIIDANNNEIAIQKFEKQDLLDRMSFVLDKNNLRNELKSGLTDEAVLQILQQNSVLDPEGQVAKVQAAISNGSLESCLEGLDINTSVAQKNLAKKIDSINNNIQIVEKDVSGHKHNFVAYNKQIIYEENLLDSQSSMNDLLASSTSKLKEVNDSILPTIGNNISSANQQVEELNEQLKFIKKNGIEDTVTKNGAFYFNDLIASGGQIRVNAEKGNSTVKGDGEMHVSVSDIMIDNYSNNDLIFNNISIAAGDSGVFVDGKNYEGSPNGTPHFVVNGKDILVFTNGSDGNLGGISINNYYDPNHPLNNTLLGSNIILNGMVNTNAGNINIYNEGGDVILNEILKAQKVNVKMPQGRFTQNTKGKTYILKEGDTLFAGKTIDITAPRFDIKGTMHSGVANKNLTITQDMIKPENLVYDKDNDCYLIKLSSKEPSIYMNDKNNIKAIYDKETNTIKLFGTRITDNAAINLNATTDDANTILISDSAKLRHADGYGKISISNESNAHMEVNNLENNNIKGGVNFKVNNVKRDLPTLKEGQVVNLAENHGNSAITNVITKGLGNLDIIGKVSSGVIQDGKHVVTMQTNGNLNVLNKKLPVVDNNGDINLIKNGNNGGITIDGNVKNVGNINVKNNGSSGVVVAGNVSNKNGKINITNSSGNIIIDNGAKLANDSNATGENLILSNMGDGKISILGRLLNKQGNIKIDSQGALSGIEIAGTSENLNGSTIINNSGSNGINVSGSIKNTKGVTRFENSSGALNIAEGANVENDSIELGETLTLANSGDGKLSILGRLFNKQGNTKIDNTKSAIDIATSGIITNQNGNVYINNTGNQKVGVNIAGKVNALNNDINITNQNSDLSIGELTSNNDSYLTAKNVNIKQTNGNIINGIIDSSKKHQNHNLGKPDQAYKTLISTSNNLNINVNGGNVGSDTHALSGKESGFGINASTRDYTESINVKVGGLVNAKATNNNNALINIRAKESNLNVDNISSDGNVMLTASDWRQADSATPTDNNYYNGYSILNSAIDSSRANVTGKNISLISSNNIGTPNSSFTYNQLENGSISALAENDIYLKGTGIKDNIWQLITKQGNIGINLDGNAVIREITSGKELKLISKGSNLTIYDLGKTSNFPSSEDILYAHDNIEISNVVPEKIDIRVYDVNPEAREDIAKANSTINIFNAFVKGRQDGTADVTLRADNVIAHAYDAASSNASNHKRPNGFDSKKDRLYSNDITDATAEKNMKATGFNTVGSGTALTFDIQGVSPNDVQNAGYDSSKRDYTSQEAIKTIEIFNNPHAFKSTIYKANDVTLSLNSDNLLAPNDNRGMLLNKLYTDNAYVDTKDLQLKAIDAFVTNYGEFRNGNRGAGTPEHSVGDNYRWLIAVDNDYNRNLTGIIPVTTQLYTKLTGSFGLDMGELIAIGTKAPVTIFNPHGLVVQPETENSFFTLTSKEAKIQKTTTTSEFADIDKSTYKPTKREFIRFAVLDNSNIKSVDDLTQSSHSRIISILDISKGGIKVLHDGSLKKGEKLVVNLQVKGLDVTPEVEVMRVSGDKAGLKFINLDPASANKILYMNMLISQDNGEKVSKL